jgi:hypothetical protein
MDLRFANQRTKTGNASETIVQTAFTAVSDGTDRDTVEQWYHEARALFDGLDGPVPRRGLRFPHREERYGPVGTGTVSMGKAPSVGADHRANAVTAALPRQADTQFSASHNCGS